MDSHILHVVQVLVGLEGVAGLSNHLAHVVSFGSEVGITHSSSTEVASLLAPILRSVVPITDKKVKSFHKELPAQVTLETKLCLMDFFRVVAHELITTQRNVVYVFLMIILLS